MTHEKRVTLAFVLCMLLALVWIQLFAAPRKKPAPEPKDGKPTVLKGKKKQKAQLGPGKLESGKKKQSPKKNGAAKKPKSSQGLTVTREAKLARVYTLESKRMRAVLSSEGGCVREVWLKNYFHKYVDRSAKGWEENPKNWLPLFPGWAALQEENKPPTDHLFQLHSSLGVELGKRLWVARQTGDSVVFELGLSNGLTIRKTISVKKTFSAEEQKERDGLSCRVEFVNSGSAPVELSWTLLGPQSILREEAYDPTATYAWLYQKGSEKDSYKEPKSSDLPDLVKEDKGYKLELKGPGEKLVGAAVHSKYFAGILWVDEFPGEGTLSAAASVCAPDAMEEAKDVSKYNLDRSIGLQLASAGKNSVAPGKTLSFGSWLEIGSRDKLTRRPFEKLLDYGFFGSVSTLLLWFLGLLNGVFQNYGVSIIVLTVIIKLTLFPLTKKQQVSMHTFQKKVKLFQPEMEKLKEKYKNNSKKQQEETLKLYRKHNMQPIPLGGCLPVLVQIPIFFGLFRALQYSLELRQAQFLWITDLASPDKLYTFQKSFILIGSDFNILPIAMTIVWFLQQKMMPKQEDPQMAQQQKMMAFMPIIFGFMLYSFAAGLCLYWFVSNLFGIFEQKYIKSQLAKDDPK